MVVPCESIHFTNLEFAITKDAELKPSTNTLSNESPIFDMLGQQLLPCHEQANCMCTKQVSMASPGGHLALRSTDNNLNRKPNNYNDTIWPWQTTINHWGNNRALADQ
jgi:hypothetical protein